MTTRLASRRLPGVIKFHGAEPDGEDVVETRSAPSADGLGVFSGGATHAHRRSFRQRNEKALPMGLGFRVSPRSASVHSRREF